MIKKEDLEQVKKDDLRRKSNALFFEMANFQDISDAIFKKIEKKINVLETLDTSLNQKISAFEKLIKKVDSVELQTKNNSRQHEVLALIKRGFSIEDISSILVMPKGEVELISNLNKWGYWNNC
jgi:hypothetical protein